MLKIVEVFMKVLPLIKKHWKKLKMDIKNLIGFGMFFHK